MAGVGWTTVFGYQVQPRSRPRGPMHRQRFLPDRTRRTFPWWWIREYEYRAGAWHVIDERPELTREAALHARPEGVIVSKPAPGIRQVDLSHRIGTRTSADPEGYQR